MNIKLNKHFSIFLFALLACMANTTVFAAAKTVVASGNWNTGGTWNGGTAPLSGDTVTIGNGFIVTMTANTSITGITISAGGTLQGDNTGKTLSVGASGINNSGTLNFTGTESAAITLTANQQWQGGGTWDLTSINAGARDLTFSGTVYISLSGAGDPLTIGVGGSILCTATVTFNYNGTAAQTMLPSASMRFGNLHINNTNASGLTQTLNTGISTTNLLGDIRIQSGTFRNGAYPVVGNAGKTFEVKANATYYMTGTTTIPSGFGTIIFEPESYAKFVGSNQAIPARDWGTVWLSMAGTGTLAAGTHNIYGTLRVTNGGATYNGTTNNPTVNITGHLWNQGTFNSGSGQLTLNGSALQTIMTGATAASDTLTITNLRINNSAGVVLNNTSVPGVDDADLNITGTLTLTSGNIVTEANKVIIASSGSIARTSGHIEGNLQRRIATGSNVARSFEIGTGTDYTPVTVSFASVSVAGDLTVSATSGDHANIASSILDSAKSVNRYWTLTNSGITFTNYSATFTFVAGDLDAGTTTSNFYIGQYVSAAWAYPVVGTRNATDTQVTGLTTFGDFAIAEETATTPTLIAEYRFDETSWAGVANEVVDSSGNNLHGRSYNGANTASTSPAAVGSPGTCSYGVFDGSNDQVQVAATTSINNLTSFTAMAWVKMGTTGHSGSFPRLMSAGGWVGSIGKFSISFDIANRTFLTGIRNSGGSSITLSYGMTLGNADDVLSGTWKHVAVTYNGATGVRTLYIGGVQRKTETIAVGSRTLNNPTTAFYVANENSSEYLNGSIDEVRIYNGPMTATQVASAMNSTHACPASDANLGGFNAYETSTAAGAITGVIKTKIAGQAFNVDLAALNVAKNAIDTTFAGDVKVELLNSSNNSVAADANGCRSTWSVIQTLSTQTFAVANSGRKTVSITENNSYPDARIRITYPATGSATDIGCSSDNFAIRPNTYTSFSVTDSNWTTAGTTRTLNNTAATGGNTHKAGRAFTIRATAVNGAGTPATTTNYAGSPTASLTALLQPTGCAGCAVGTLSVGTWSASSGAITTTTASYTEVGAFTMQLQDQTFAAVDAADGSTTSERYITSAALNVGRFVPDHFDLSTANTPQFRTFNDTTCGSRSFTYVGQTFSYITAPRVTITAKNSSNATTINYSQNLWKITVPTSGSPVFGSGTVTTGDVVQTYTATPALDLNLIGLPALTINHNGTGTLAMTNGLSGDRLLFTRNATTPQSSFNASISLGVSATDDSETDGSITTTTSATFNGSGSGIAFDSGNQFRYGRLLLASAHGSELLALPLTLETQYWNGTGFVTNTADNCTILATSNVALKNYRKNLAANETTPTFTSSRFAAGKGSLKLSAPGNGNAGSVEVCIDLDVSGGDATCSATGAGLTHLQGKWSGTNYDKDPSSRATFGVYKNNNEFVYTREGF